MKVRNIILLSFAIILLGNCKDEETEEPYSNEFIVRDNAQAALYIHTIFREAENAWAFIDSAGYVTKTYEIGPSTSYKWLIYNESTKTVTIKYHAWISDNLKLDGNIAVVFDKGVYLSDGKIATVKLNDFFIQEQSVTGELSMKYRAVAGSTTAHYDFTVTDGAIREVGNSMPVLISCSIADGKYERTAGGATKTKQADDVWAYYGTMKGMLHDDTNLTYTNVVVTSYTEGGVQKDGKVYYKMGCKTAETGLSQVKIAGRPDIVYGYFCNRIEFVSTTDVE